ncbi:bacillithiol system redox-active protein YtxJ [Cytobacillus sp. S13-E01]|uniref:bacillithiol system redox-active protein YtxJ n=1 Tax=Cytobacillus sp. S13-E01 TaxID=3031326 RepID=UPI0023D86F55|nr:bacillithiol system redox-active protein YtxJ [Cytobacillus sp. S13-E01]MDF0726454.1 bacillithiol system redox-active protein YtxJ [Cytobacillus sp. S13-E01]
MKQLESVEQFNEVFEANEKLLLLKHSNTCPISQAGYEEFEKFVEAHTDVQAYYLVVQDSRSLSNYVAETYHVKHESPQVVLFKNKDVAWHTSHWKITYETLTKEVVG